MATTMTALDMANQFKWVSLTVNFNYGTGHGGHVCVEGQTRIIGEGGSGSAVWVGQVCLDFNTIVYVEPVGSEGAKANVHRIYQRAEAA